MLCQVLLIIRYALRTAGANRQTPDAFGLLTVAKLRHCAPFLALAGQGLRKLSLIRCSILTGVALLSSCPRAAHLVHPGEHVRQEPARVVRVHLDRPRHAPRAALRQRAYEPAQRATHRPWEMVWDAQMLPVGPATSWRAAFKSRTHWIAQSRLECKY